MADPLQSVANIVRCPRGGVDILAGRPVGSARRRLRHRRVRFSSSSSSGGGEVSRLVID